MSARIWNILMLCTGNSARSILGEALFNALGAGRVRAFSAGSKPKDVPHPGALAALARNGLPAEGFRSKSWEEFSAPRAPAIDMVVTVCDNAALEICPIFPGKHIKAHWGIADPADAPPGAEEKAAFERAFAEMKQRIEHFLALDFATMEGPTLTDAIAAIGNLDGATTLRKQDNRT